MHNWRDEFLAGIRDAERRNPVNRELIDACSQLADRVSALEAEKAALQAQLANPPLSPSTAGSKSPQPQPPPASSTDPSPDDSPLIAHLRLDLAEALRSKGQFQTRLQTAEDELSRLRHKTASDTKHVKELTAERKILSVKLRDRDEELRAKNKLVADVQDELAVLNLQLNVVERRRKEKEEENKQLVERFMRRVGQEADAMNLANEPLFNKRRGGRGEPGDRDRGR